MKKILAVLVAVVAVATMSYCNNEYSYNKKTGILTVEMKNGMQEIEKVDFLVDDLVFDRYSVKQVAEMLQLCDDDFLEGFNFPSTVKYSNKLGLVSRKGGRIDVSHYMISKNGYGVEGETFVHRDYDPITGSCIVF